jgi:hypothetical protein
LFNIYLYNIVQRSIRIKYWVSTFFHKLILKLQRLLSPKYYAW